VNSAANIGFADSKQNIIFCKQKSNEIIYLRFSAGSHMLLIGFNLLGSFD
jgi:hypothetical protein